ncbi:hypothetical protein [Porphyrobacter sp. GA68]|uniref:hypothetical protein n=1 Tax=Porphyrobacter sp. GA68 TaxID=2883480 RepID=UPI001D182554|nr:hypothetical protein [Porphyrobacter sp. GA68]
MPWQIDGSGDLHLNGGPDHHWRRKKPLPTHFQGRKEALDQPVAGNAIPRSA